MRKLFLLINISIFILLCSCTLLNKSATENIDKTLDYSSLKDLDMSKDNIILKIDGTSLDLKTPIYLEKNRYYFCLNDLIDNLKGTIEVSNETLNIKVLNKDISIDTSNNKLSFDSKELDLKNQLIKQNNFYYICFTDFANMLNLYTRWDIPNKTLNCKINGDCMENIQPYKASIEQKGYLRIEDVALTTLPYDYDYLEKLRIMGNYLSKKDIPYHIAWIPRYISPANNTDVDPITQNNFQTAELIYTLDYLTYHKGVIGLHGYTHQRNNDESSIGSEFGYKFPSTSEFEERIQKALNSAEYLNIPIDFFETPHYEITPEQNRIAEKYFKILYYPFKDNGPKKIDYTKPQISPYNNTSYYISTYLDYVHENGDTAFINKIKTADTSYMGSMFFHPRLDFKYINLTDNNGIPGYNYDENSILKRVINALEEKGYKMSSVKDL